MSIQDRTNAVTGKTAAPAPRVPEAASPGNPPALHRSAVRSPATAKALAVLRIVMGLTFLWAFLDKTFGLGYSTTSAQAWINGGSPTKGFLAHVEVGPLQSVLRAWAGSGWADWLFMVGLLGIGVALLFGVGMRLAATTGTLLLAFMWIAEWPLAQHTSTGAATASSNPIIDYHLVYIAVVIVLALVAAGNTWGLGHWWAKQNFVSRNAWLR
jgi:thiosulfate dehydrogenase (quinone) large subunit